MEYTPAEMLNDVWSKLEDGADHRTSAFHLATLGTMSSDGPSLRTVVLRTVDRRERMLGFHSDIRSPKVRDIQQDPRVSCLFYDPNQRIQIRCRGHMKVHHSDERAQERWSASSHFARRCYLGAAPGALLGEGQSALPKAWQPRAPTESELQKGFEHFAFLSMVIDKLESLTLERPEHKRFCFDLSASPLCVQRLAP